MPTLRPASPRPTPPRSAGPGAARAIGLAAGLLAAACLAPGAARAQTEGACVDTPTNLCLDDDRFEVTVEWHDFTPNPFFLPSLMDSSQGQGQGVKLQPTTNVDSGYFWFFDQQDVELVVKIIDGRSINNHFWVFGGSLSNVEYTLRVTDTQTNHMVTYFNPPGDRSVIADTRAFEEDGGGGTGGNQVVGAAHRRRLLPKEELPSCADDTVTCVRDGRFAIQSIYRGPNAQNMPVAGRAGFTSETSALLSHGFEEANADTFVKVVDGREVNGSFWVTASTILGLPPGVELTVTDLETGRAATYLLSQDEAVAVGDRQPFAPDPPAGPWLETAAIPGFRFKVRVVGGGAEVPVRQESECIPETLCISGAVPGRSELFLRIVGPKPNGFLWPTIVKFSTSQIEVWADQLSSGIVNYYLLDGATPGSDELTGLFDRTGFTP